MACFYCGKRKLTSPDVGDCEESCAKAVCIQTTSIRPQDYHADQCNCGCGKLVCIYEQSQHSRRTHNSNVEDCFPGSVALAGLGAAWAIEHSAQVPFDRPGADQAEIRSAVFRYVTVTRPSDRDFKLPFGTSDEPNYFDLELPGRQQWPGVAAALVPYVINSIIRSWPKVRNPDYKYGLGRKLNERLDALASSGALPGQLERNPAAVLPSWFAFSPRLALLVVQHGASTSLRDRTRGMSFDLGLPWTDAPATLDEVIQQQGAPPLVL